MKMGLGLGFNRPVIAAAPSGDGSLSDVVASTVFDLDATQSASYGGSGTTWANLATAPADGEVQSAYNVTNGGWAFTGTAGDPAAYWVVDTINRGFTLASNTAFANALHKTTGGTSWWMAFAVQTPSAGQLRFLGTAPNSGTGLLIQTNTSDAFNSFHVVGSSFNSFPITTAIPDTGYSIVIFTFNPATGDMGLWVNSATGVFDTDTLTATTADATGTLTIGAYSATAGGSGAGARIVTAAMGNEYLDNTKAAAIISALETRHGRDYTP